MTAAPFTAVLLVLAACGTLTSNADNDTRAYEAYPTIAINAVLPALDAPAEATVTALRVDPPEQTTTTTMTGLWGLPYAPEGLSGCDEMDFYRRQWGLPDRFNQLGWRESRCTNDDQVRTWCCYGYLQLYVTLHLSDLRLILHYHACEVDEPGDVDSDSPYDKQRQMCAAAALYDVVGYQAWAL